jgi:long-subunit acyl-CoA synthetase (AMP-forming)
VNIWGFNSPEWVIAALASSFAGGKVAGLYPTDTQDTAAFKVVHSGGSVVLVEDRTKLKKLVNGITERGDAQRIKVFVAWGFEPAENETVTVAGLGLFE